MQELTIYYRSKKKTTHYILNGSRPVVDFTNILRATFAPVDFYLYYLFHHHFTQDFCANIFVPKNYKAKTKLEKSYSKHFLYKKFALKMLMKLTPNLP